MTETGDIRIPVGRGLYQRNREQCFRRGGKDRFQLGRECLQFPAHCQNETKIPEGNTLRPRYPSRQNQVRRSN